MAAVYLLLSVAGFTSMSLMVKVSERKVRSARGLVCAMFLFASAVVLCMLLLSPSRPELGARLPLLGAGAGVSSVLAFACTSYAIRRGHFGFAVTFANASFLLSVLFSVLVWNKPLGWLGCAGLLLVLLGLVALSGNDGKKAGGAHASKLLWLGAVWASFLLSGVCQVCQASATRLPAEEYDSTFFLLIQYAVGGLLLLPGAIRNREFERPAVLFGMAAAVSSIFGTFFIMRALCRLPESLVFPVCLCAPILISVLLSFAFFKEPVRARGGLGVALGVAGLVLLSVIGG